MRLLLGQDLWVIGLVSKVAFLEKPEYPVCGLLVQIGQFGNVHSTEAGRSETCTVGSEFLPPEHT